jgi:hypothetical protein
MMTYYSSVRLFLSRQTSLKNAGIKCSSGIFSFRSLDLVDGIARPSKSLVDCVKTVSSSALRIKPYRLFAFIVNFENFSKVS